MASQQNLSENFSGKATAYQLSRPSYPEALLSRLAQLIPPGAAVADIGAGTGKLTTLLVARGFAVTAVEPNRDMREELVAAVEGDGGTVEADGKVQEQREASVKADEASVEADGGERARAGGSVEVDEEEWAQLGGSVASVEVDEEKRPQLGGSVASVEVDEKERPQFGSSVASDEAPPSQHAQSVKFDEHIRVAREASVAADSSAQSRSAHSVARDKPLHVVAALADATGLPPHSQAAVTVAQALHWFDPVSFRAECQRILAPGGLVCSIYNTFDGDKTPSNLPRRSGHAGNSAAAFFKAPHIETFDNPQIYDRARWQRFMASHSHSPRSDSPDYPAYRARMDTIFDEQAGVDGRYHQPCKTYLYWEAI